MKNIFNAADAAEVIERINRLTPSTQRQWGKMSVSQMLAHCSVSYEMVYDNKHPKPNVMMKFILRLLVKEAVVGKKPYPKGGATGTAFIIHGERDFDKEKIRLINYINKTLELGETYFEGRQSHSFGPLTTAEWNIMFFKHLDHHLSQFGV